MAYPAYSKQKFQPWSPGIAPPTDPCVRFCTVRHEWAHFTDTRPWNLYWSEAQQTIFWDSLAYTAELHCLRLMLLLAGGGL
jgi:hypothetical protein